MENWKTCKQYTHISFPVTIETAGAWNHLAIELVQEIGQRITAVTEEPRESVFLFQRLSIRSFLLAVDTQLSTS